MNTSTEPENKPEKSIRARLAHFLEARAGTRQLPLNITLGILIGFSESFFAISLISLIFTGPLNAYLSIGISIGFATTIITLLMTALFTSLPFGIGKLQEAPIIIMAVLIGSYITASARLGETELLSTVLTTLILGTLVSALLLYLVGFFKLGELVRYIPFPVVGGFLAGTGWLITEGSLSLVIDKFPTTSAELILLFSAEIIVVWLPAVLCGVLLFVAMRKIKHTLTLPFTLILLLIAFYTLLSISGISIDRATELGLLLGDLGQPELYLLSINTLRMANWQSIFGQIGNIGALAGLSLVSFLLYLTSIEVTFHQELDINKELRSAGATNLLNTFAGGMIGFLSLSLSTLAYRGGSRNRMPGVTAAAVMAAIFFFGFASLAYFPVPLITGVILYIGLSFLYEWTVAAWQRFSKLEYAVILLILIVIALTDFLIGILVGLAVMIVMFVVSYSQIKTIQLTLTGSDLQSNVCRNAIQRRWLETAGESVQIMILRGFLFFGTANTIVRRMRALLDEPGKRPLCFIILDFKNVTGMDSSAALSFMRVEETAREHGFKVIFCNLTENYRRSFARGGVQFDNEIIHSFPDLDRGLEWCEEQLLRDEFDPSDALPDEILDQLIRLGFDETSAHRLLSHLEPVELQPGDYIIHKDDLPDALYYIERGRVAVILEYENGDPIRLRALTQGATVGEMGLYSGERRSASVIADEPTRLHRLSMSTMEALSKEDPELLASFHRWVAVSLSERLAQNSRTTGALNAD